MTKDQILKILKANFVYSKTAEKIANEILELQEEPLLQKEPKSIQKEDIHLTEEQKETLRNLPF